jgi:hypothetical protein
MTIDITEKATIIKDFDSNLDQLLIKLINENLENQNIILDISHYRALKPKDLNIFFSFAKKTNKNKKSFVIVILDFDFNKASEKINIVPTIQEAFDIIEMEEIERDLGF